MKIVGQYLDSKEDKAISTKSLSEPGKIVFKECTRIKFSPPLTNLFTIGIERRLFENKT